MAIVDTAESPSFPCLHGARMLIAIASYGTGRERRLSALLRTLHALRGVNISVHLDRTVSGGDLKLPLGLRVSQATWPDSVGYGLTGRYRSVFRAALQASSYDFYLYTEDDHGLTSAHIEALCCETRYLETHWRGAARLFATAKRFVTLPIGAANSVAMASTGRYMNDQSVSDRHAVQVVFTVQHRKFVQLGTHGYAALFFASAGTLADAIARAEEPPAARTSGKGRGHETQVRHRLRWEEREQHKEADREDNAGLWLHRMARNPLVPVLPLDNLEAHLVQHLGERRVRHVVREGALASTCCPHIPSWELLRAAIGCFSGAPLKLAPVNGRPFWNETRPLASLGCHEITRRSWPGSF